MGLYLNRRALKYFISLLVLILGINNVYSQAKNDYTWIMGYPPNHPENHFGGVKIDFDENIGISAHIDPCFPLVIDPPTDTPIYIRFVA